ncbi:PREDICTED: neutrophil collagenase [Nicrophorus vespilloides]|uniref:Neutrophil collagenase n=1 Tax=Nicrophorus vespilloides TaxID=110193 RepID=A0ABM1MRM1_NICVS|nr:PREDICTED: neutrophil collagenase [Nicrophorus vespilloides]
MRVQLLLVLLLKLVENAPVGRHILMKKYLKQFGYDTDNMPMAVKNFQQFHHLQINGKMNEETLSMMDKPRCGMPDDIYNMAFHGPVLQNRNLSYKVENYGYLVPSEVDEALKKAFDMWQNYTELNFKHFKRIYVMRVNFNRLNHGDKNDFDGPGQMIGHATPPVNNAQSDIHFDLDEDWTWRGDNGINFFQTAVHELGHALGLSHINETDSVMYPYYTYKENYSLTKSDIARIQYLYGVRDRSIDNQVVNPTCIILNYNTIFVYENLTYVFRGKYYWAFNEEGYRIEEMRLINEKWPFLPSNIDAAYVTDSNKVIFFKGLQYWKYYKSRLLKNYPKLNYHGYSGAPERIDAAVKWNNTLLLFKDTEIWSYEPGKGSTSIGKVNNIVNAAIVKGNDLILFGHRIFSRCTSINTNCIRENISAYFKCNIRNTTAVA